VPLSRAAAASSAVPVVFSPVTINNYGGTCDRVPPAWVKPFVTSDDPPRPAARAIRSLKAEAALGDGVRRPYLHLVDGGVSDNPAESVDRLRAAAATLIMDSPEFKRLLNDVGARLIAAPPAAGSPAEAQ
jgi:hypothetical protein